MGRWGALGNLDKYILTFRMTKHVLKHRYSAPYLVKILEKHGKQRAPLGEIYRHRQTTNFQTLEWDLEIKKHRRDLD